VISGNKDWYELLDVIRSVFSELMIRIFTRSLRIIQGEFFFVLMWTKVVDDGMVEVKIGLKIVCFMVEEIDSLLCHWCRRWKTELRIIENYKCGFAFPNCQSPFSNLFQEGFIVWRKGSKQGGTISCGDTENRIGLLRNQIHRKEMKNTFVSSVASDLV
jgi:hypothetical protein